MKISSKAINFLLKTKVNENKEKELLKALMTGDLLKSYDFSDDIISAGYLHNLSNITNCTNEDISKKFGGNIESLVITSQASFDLNEQERKKMLLKFRKNLPVRNRVIIIASEIVDLEMKHFYKEDIYHEEEIDYYDKLLQILEENIEDKKTNQLLDHFYETIITTFGKKSEKFNHTNSFSRLKSEQEELKKLKQIFRLEEDYMILISKENHKPKLSEIIKKVFQDDIFKITVSNFNNKHAGEFSAEERNALLISELEYNFLIDSSKGKDVLILDINTFERMSLSFNYLKQQKINTKELDFFYKHYMKCLKYSFMLSGSKKLINHQKKNINYQLNLQHQENDSA